MPVASSLRPGLRDEEMDALTAPLGLRLPREARRWWGWHDGASAQPGFEPEVIGPPSMSFFPLADAVERTGSIRKIQNELWERFGWEGSEPDWKPGWLVLTNPERPIVIDCSVGLDDPVPVRSFFFQEPMVAAEGVKSLGELIRIWIYAFDSGAWGCDLATAAWH